MAGVKELTATELLKEFDAAASNRPGRSNSQASLNRDTRFTYWTNQDDSGRKMKARTGEAEVFPWKGASDVRVPLIDMFINEDVALEVNALNRAKIKATPVESGDAKRANLQTDFLRWMAANQMTERNAESRLFANYMKEDGKAIMAVMWERKVEMGYNPLSMEEIKALAAEAQSAEVEPGSDQESAAALLRNLPGMILDPAMDEQTAVVIQQFASELVRRTIKKEIVDEYPDLLENYELKLATAKRAVQELRENETAQIPVPVVKCNRPVITALKVGVDVFLSDGTTDIDSARYLFWQEWMTEETLRGKGLTSGWDENWVDYVVKHGKGDGRSGSSVNRQPVEHGMTDEDVSEMYGVIHVFMRKLSKDGVPGIYCTAIHRCTSTVGLNDVPEFAYEPRVLNYDHGAMPFVLGRREYLSRRFDDSRGYGEIGFTWQNTIKAETDMVIDRGSLTINPPLHHPKGKPPSKWGPGCKVPGNKNDYHFADTPEYDPSILVGTQRMETLARQYFGRPVNDMDMAIVTVLLQDRVDNWLEVWKQVYVMILQLCQQFMPEEFYFRVVGAKKGETIRATREEIQGKFDVTLTFDARDLDPEQMKAKLELLQQIVGQLDVNGLVDRDELLAVVFEWFDPVLGERLLKPGEEASQQQVEDEQTVFARIWAGIDQDVKPGQAYRMRLQVLNDIIAGQNEDGSPKNPEAMKRYQSDEVFRAKVDRRIQQLKFQDEQQRVNPVAGRLGGMPAGVIGTQG